MTLEEASKESGFSVFTLRKYCREDQFAAIRGNSRGAHLGKSTRDRFAIS